MAKKAKKAPCLEDLIVQKNDLLIFWSDVMVDPGVSDRDKLKASEFLAKHYQMFVEKVEGKLELTAPAIVVNNIITEIKAMNDKQLREYVLKQKDRFDRFANINIFDGKGT